MRFARFLATVLGVLMAFAAFGVLLAGGVLLWLHGTQRTDDGFLVSPDYHITSTGHAITSSDIDFGAQPGDWWPEGMLDVRLEVDGTTFVGIGPADMVDLYLDGVATAEITRLGPDASAITTTEHPGSVIPTPPAVQDFWVATGTAGQPLEWEVEPGTWAVVVMNENGSAGVDTMLTAGAKVAFLFGAAIAIVVFGVFLGLAAAGLLVFGLVRRAPDEQRVPQPVGVAAMSPVTVEGRIDEPLSRWMWLVKWLLAFPHFVVLAALLVGAVFAWIGAFFSILFTGRYPRSLFDYMVGVMRWSWRVGYYAFDVLATDRYPPFTLDDVPDYPARLDVVYPERLSQGLVLVKWWLLAIPHYLIVGLLTGGTLWWASDRWGDLDLQASGGLIGLLAFIAVIILAIRGAYPKSLFDLLMGLHRWVFRVAAYAALMTDEYPPFRLDLGGSEPRPDLDRPPPEGGEGSGATRDEVTV